jgi:hypothetical protein
MIRLEMSKLAPTTANPQGGWRVAVIVETDGVPGRRGVGAPVQLCSGAGSTKEDAAGWARHHLRRLASEGDALLEGFGANQVGA